MLYYVTVVQKRSLNRLAIIAEWSGGHVKSPVTVDPYDALSVVERSTDLCWHGHC